MGVHRTFKLRVGTALLAASLLGLGACSSDGSSGDDSSPASAEETTPTTSAATAERLAFCRASAEAQSLSGGPFLDPTVSIEEFNANATDILDEVRRLAPETIEEPLAVIVSTIEQVMQTANPALMEEPAYLRADDSADTTLNLLCNPQEATVTAGDHFFHGFPSQVPLEAGLVEITVVNEGAEDHEMIVKREGESAVTGYVRVHPGQRESILMDVSAGSYTAVCNLTHQGGGHGDAATTQTHAELGMSTTFEVTAG